MFPLFCYFSSKYSIGIHTYLCGENRDAYLVSFFFTMYTHFNQVLKMTALQKYQELNVFLLLLQMEHVHIKFHSLTYLPLILIDRVNIGKRAILNKNIGIIGHFLKDREI